MRYLIVYEKTRTGYSAFLPDIPGCVATGHSRDEVARNIRDALGMHVTGMKEDGEKPGPAEAFADYEEIEVS